MRIPTISPDMSKTPDPDEPTNASTFVEKRKASVPDCITSLTCASPAYLRGRPSGWPMLMTGVPIATSVLATRTGEATESGTLRSSRTTAQSFPPVDTEISTEPHE